MADGYSNAGADNSQEELRKKQAQIALWLNSTATMRRMFTRDYEYTDGNGRQWAPADRARVIKSKRPALEFNQVLPQVLLVAGMHRDMKLSYVAQPRGIEDARLGEIVIAGLRATADFTRIYRVNDRVTDDATVCGLGVWELLHSFDDAEDMVFGDIIASRIDPRSFIFDPWCLSGRGDMQDAEFVGKFNWYSQEGFIEKYGEKSKRLAVPGDWVTMGKRMIESSSSDLGLGANLEAELWDSETGRIRVATLWGKKPQAVTMLVDHNTGRVFDMPSKQAAQQYLDQIAARVGREAVAQFEPIVSDRSSAVVSKGTADPIPDMETGEPMTFGDPQSAQAHLNLMGQKAGMHVYSQFEVITRKSRVPHWCDMTWGEELDSGPSSFKDRLYPFVPLISQQFTDDPESIMGIVRNLHDPQDEYNKRYSNLLGHLNSNSHSGWFNRKSGGASTSELAKAGSVPGVVIEYTSIKPEQIKPVEISQGHFLLLNVSQQNIRTISGVNADMTGQQNAQTVSGRAIRARQAGGATVMKPRLRRYEECQLDLAKMMVSRIQQFYPPEKMRRIIGVFESAIPLGPQMQPIFSDPLTGNPMPDEQIIEQLSTMRNVNFDLTIQVAPYTDSDRQVQFEKALQLTEITAKAGFPIGPGTIKGLVDLADAPTKFTEGLKRDVMMAAMAGNVGQPEGGAAGAAENAINKTKGGAAGGSAESAGGSPSSGEGMGGTSGGQGVQA